MFQAIETMPAAEAALHHERLRDRMRRHAPDASGFLAFSRVPIYWLSGTMAAGVFWLPADPGAEPVLLLRKSVERARLESQLKNILAFRSYGDIKSLLAEAGSPLPDGAPVAVETSGLTWALGDLFRAKLPGVDFLPGDQCLAKAMSLKTEWELAKMRLAGARHHECLHALMPAMVRPGMSEREISHRCWEAFFSRGHSGIMRMGNFGEEIFLGHVSAGDSGNYPSHFNGPLGLRGEHPATTFMGYAGKLWSKGEPLALDIGFCLEGYQTDKTQILWAGPESSIPDNVRRGHDFCIAVQTWIAERMKPGAIPSELYAHCVDWAAREGWADSFMGLGGNQVKFIGHGIGLTIDGWPVIAKGFDEPLEEGVCMALEPKMGFPGLGMVGVENTFEVTSEGGRCITGDSYEMVCVE